MRADAAQRQIAEVSADHLTVAAVAGERVVLHPLHRATVRHVAFLRQPVKPVGEERAYAVLIGIGDPLALDAVGHARGVFLGLALAGENLGFLADASAIGRVDRPYRLPC